MALLVGDHCLIVIPILIKGDGHGHSYEPSPVRALTVPARDACKPSQEEEIRRTDTSRVRSQARYNTRAYSKAMPGFH